MAVFLFFYPVHHLTLEEVNNYCMTYDLELDCERGILIMEVQDDL